jgi:Condensation domain
VTTASRSRYHEFRASIAQERRLLVDAQRGDGRDRLVRLAFDVGGPLSEGALRSALSFVMDRHDALRSSFHLAGGTAVQRVHDGVATPLSIVDVEAADDPAAGRWLDAQATRPIDRSLPPPFRVAAGRTGRERHLLAFLFDHLVVDGWSLEVFLGELSDAYAAALGGRTPDLPPVTVQLPEWSEAQRRWLSGDRLERLVGRWRRRLGEDPTAIALALRGLREHDGSRPFRGERLRALLEGERVARLRAMAAAERATLYGAVLACLATVLAEESGRDRMLLTTSFANRARAGLERTMGRLSHPLIFALDLAGARDPGSALRAVRLALLDALGDAELPFELLRREVWPGTYLATTTAPTVYYDLATPPGEGLRLAGAAVRALDWDDDSCIPGLEFLGLDRGAELDVQLGFEVTTYSRGYAGTILARFLERVAQA